jgi:hypothetical protein
VCSSLIYSDNAHLFMSALIVLSILFLNAFFLSELKMKFSVHRRRKVTTIFSYTVLNKLKWLMFIPCMRVAQKVMQQFFSHSLFILLKLQICHIAT